MMVRALHFSHKSIKDFGVLIHKKMMPKENIANLLVADDETYLMHASSWLLNATKIYQGRGVAADYCLFGGWKKPYPETTGYIIPTYLKLSEHYAQNFFFEVAVKNGKWLTQNFTPDGGIVGLGGNSPVIFDTGQVLHGLISLYEKTRDEFWINFIDKASRFLYDNQDSDGAYRRNTYRGIEHDYNVRTAWALIRAGKALKNDDFIESAISNIKYVINKSSSSSYPYNANTKPGKLPHTHGIGYTLRGILEAGLLLSQFDFIEFSFTGAKKLQKRFELEGRLACYISKDWENKAFFECPTGNCQIAIVWLKLAEIFDDFTLLNSAIKMIDICKRYIALNSFDKNVVGALPGSFPIFGLYSPCRYPNWATKFFIDALLEKIRLKDQL